MWSFAMSIERITTDVLIIGSGGAGLRAAIAATEAGVKVLVVAKEQLKDAHTGWAVGRINGAIKAPATPEIHFQDTINRGCDINNYKPARIFTEKISDRRPDPELCY